MINFKFILIATLTFIPYTVLWFLWHNNLFPHIYYASGIVNSIHAQNIWAMNFANALLVYGFVYFFRRSVRYNTPIYKVVLWGVYYNLSIIGFFSFMLLGILQNWELNFVIFDLIWAVVGGASSGMLACILNLLIDRPRDE